MYKHFAEYSEILASRRELYKRYGIGLDQSGLSSGVALEPMRFKQELERNALLNFGAVASASVQQSCEGVEVSGTANASAKDYEAKGLDLGDEQSIADFISSNSVCDVRVEASEGSDVSANILFVADSFLPVKITVNAERGSNIRLLEWFASEGMGIMPLHEISAGSSANVDISVVHNESDSAKSVSLASATAAERAVIQINQVFSGSAKSKSAVFATAEGDASSVGANSIVIGSGSQAFDIGSVLRGIGKNTNLQARTGAVLLGRSHCLIKDFAKVCNTAKGSYSYVEERGLLLSSDSNFVPLPDMSIDTKNVSFASHSASSAPLSGESVFYMMSRGMSEEHARRSLTLAFLMHYINGMSNAKAKEVAASIINSKALGGGIDAAPQLSIANVWQ
ncbi:MAG: SufD family Fe-S cluster assembly protein [Candidatus Micrarchaeaceae archaeon]